MKQAKIFNVFEGGIFVDHQIAEHDHNRLWSVLLAG